MSRRGRYSKKWLALGLVVWGLGTLAGMALVVGVVVVVIHFIQKVW